MGKPPLPELPLEILLWVSRLLSKAWDRVAELNTERSAVEVTDVSANDRREPLGEAPSSRLGSNENLLPAHIYKFYYTTTYWDKYILIEYFYITSNESNTFSLKLSIELLFFFINKILINDNQILHDFYNLILLQEYFVTCINILVFFFISLYEIFWIF